MGQSSAWMAFVIYLPPIAHSVHFPLALLTTQEWGFAQPGLQQFVNCVLAVVFSSFVINVHEIAVASTGTYT